MIANHLAHDALRRHPRLIGRRGLGHASVYGDSRATCRTCHRQGAGSSRLEQKTSRNVLFYRRLSLVSTLAMWRSLPRGPEQYHWAGGSFCTLAGKRRSQFLPHHGGGSPTRCDRRRPRRCAWAAAVRAHSSTRNSEEALDVVKTHAIFRAVVPCAVMAAGQVPEHPDQGPVGRGLGRRETSS